MMNAPCEKITSCVGSNTSINSAPMSSSGSFKLRYKNCLGILGNASQRRMADEAGEKITQLHDQLG
jgi:hypothetical protein